MPGIALSESSDRERERDREKEREREKNTTQPWSISGPCLEEELGYSAMVVGF